MNEPPNSRYFGAVRDEQLLRRRLGEDGHAALLRIFGKPPCETREREDPVPVVVHRRRRRDAQRVAPSEDVHGLVVHGAVRRQILNAVAELPERARVYDGAREKMGARLLALLEQRDRDVAEPLRHAGMLLEQLTEADRARQPGRSSADDEDTDLDALVGGIGRRAPELAGRE